jgi:hypothetical protein
MLNLPAGHMSEPGVGDVEPGAHAYPGLQLLHATAPDTLKRPAPHICAAGVEFVEPGRHA